MKHEVMAGAARIGVELTDEQGVALATFGALLVDRAVPLGMLSPNDRDRVVERHLLDALRAAPLLAGSSAVVDLGSGAGVPGIPLSIAFPEIRFVLAEHRRQRVAFLEMTVERAHLTNVEVAHGRVSRLPRASFDVALARAFGDAQATWLAAEALLRDTGRVVYWAGEAFDVGRDGPQGVSTEVALTTALAKAGPLVIMTRQ